MIDWDLAVAIGSRLAGDGPRISRAKADAAVSELRAGANRSTGLVRDFTGLVAPERTAPVAVVDRAGWVRANADGFAAVLAPLADKVAGKEHSTRIGRAIGSRVSGAEVGGVLGFLAGRVLGQFDPFLPPNGRLLLVAPNIVQAEAELSVDPRDFRLWVCLHEETHRVQFTSAPWLGEHLLEQMRALSDSLEPSTLLDDGLEHFIDSVRTGLRSGNLLEVVSTPAQQEILDRVTGVMSLLEGHADVVMDGVGPQVIPSVAEIRKRFNRRRKHVGVLDRVLRRLLGLDAKMAQYRDGARFVRSVIDKSSMTALNTVFDRPENLPSRAEIADPDSWIARVL